MSSKQTQVQNINILFVCMGNICRSPTAHGVFQQLVHDHQLDNSITVDSAGTHDYHIGKSPDKRATAAAMKRGYDLSNLRARQVADSDFKDFDYVLAMDDDNFADLTTQCKAQHEAQYKDKVIRFLAFAKRSDELEVPDPYYGGAQGFERVLDLVEDASKGLLEHIKSTHLPIRT